MPKGLQGFQKGHKIWVGKHHTDDTKRKVSEANKGRKCSEESRKRLSESHKGYVMPEEQKRKISIALKKARFMSEEEKKKIRDSVKEKKCSICKEVKPKENFYKDKRSLNGLYSHCIVCQSKRRKGYVSPNKKISDKKYREKYRVQLTKKYLERRRNDPKFRLDGNMATAIGEVLGDQKFRRSWKDLVGYTAYDLMKHLESQFDDKMTLDNYGSYWSVDHIKPKSLFKYETAEDSEFKKCWALENLQPLEKIANIKKRDKYEKSKELAKDLKK